MIQHQNARNRLRIELIGARTSGGTFYSAARHRRQPRQRLGRPVAGNGYWNPHPGDNPMAMVTGELIPLCRRFGLGRSPQRIGAMGISMGGYGALLLAEKYPHLITAVAAISPCHTTPFFLAQEPPSLAFLAGHLVR